MSTQTSNAIQIGQLKTIRAIQHSDPDMQGVVKRLHEMGLYVDLEIEIVRQISFGGVTVIRFHQSLLALNAEELSCLKF